MAFSAPIPQSVLSQRNAPIACARKQYTQGNNKTCSGLTAPSAAINRRLSEKIHKLQAELSLERDRRMLLEEQVGKRHSGNEVANEPGRLGKHVVHAPRTQRQYLHSRALEEKLIERTQQLKETEAKLRGTVKQLIQARKELTNTKAHARECEIKLNTFYSMSKSIVQLSVQSSTMQSEQVFNNVIKPQLSHLGASNVGVNNSSSLSLEPAKESAESVMDLLGNTQFTKQPLEQQLEQLISKQLDNLSSMIPSWEVLPDTNDSEVVVNDVPSLDTEPIVEVEDKEPYSLWQALREQLREKLATMPEVPATVESPSVPATPRNTSFSGEETKLYDTPAWESRVDQNKTNESKVESVQVISNQRSIQENRKTSVQSLQSETKDESHSGTDDNYWIEPKHLNVGQDKHQSEQYSNDSSEQHIKVERGGERRLPPFLQQITQNYISY